MNSQNFGKIGRKMPVFWQKNAKNCHFCRNSGIQLKKKCRRKINQVLGKWSNWPKNWYKCTLGYLLQLQRGIFGYFAFLQFYGCRNATRGRFLAIFVVKWTISKITENGHILPKNDPNDLKF